MRLSVIEPDCNYYFIQHLYGFSIDDTSAPAILFTPKVF
jgi:hypothetical protein